jgi:hypothetical protein
MLAVPYTPDTSDMPTRTILLGINREAQAQIADGLAEFETPIEPQM